MAWLYQPSRRFGQIVWSMTGRLTITGQEAMPPYGPLLVASNHLSLNDAGSLVVALPRQIVFLAKKELWNKPVGRFYCNAVGAVPLDRERGGGEALRYALQALEKDQAILMFPEGGISQTRQLRQARTGLAWLALKTQAPILPVGIAGSEKFPSWRMPVPLASWQVNIGTPFTPPQMEGPINKAMLNSVSDMVMERIAALLPESYRGVYADRLRPRPPAVSTDHDAS
ncbi:MAG: 1-acyl-sn-glycerol-3-phosphate acyltransferase [Chloroflexi bacterium]|nr:1-acyl-sn-glycerol-3-phosphate acyltransferase [Chloroflexota bacterium]MYD48828.1 1-acyl-sn-glycerol-3-phosphate acyltransferase [Chloroflexota bacterium]